MEKLDFCSTKKGKNSINQELNKQSYKWTLKNGTLIMITATKKVYLNKLT